MRRVKAGKNEAGGRFHEFAAEIRAIEGRMRYSLWADGTPEVLGAIAAAGSLADALMGIAIGRNREEAERVEREARPLFRATAENPCGFTRPKEPARVVAVAEPEEEPLAEPAEEEPLAEPLIGQAKANLDDWNRRRCWEVIGRRADGREFWAMRVEAPEGLTQATARAADEIPEDHTWFYRLTPAEEQFDHYVDECGGMKDVEDQGGYKVAVDRAIFEMDRPQEIHDPGWPDLDTPVISPGDVGFFREAAAEAAGTPAKAPRKSPTRRFQATYHHTHDAPGIDLGEVAGYSASNVFAQLPEVYKGQEVAVGDEVIPIDPGKIRITPAPKEPKGKPKRSAEDRHAFDVLGITAGHKLMRWVGRVYHVQDADEASVQADLAFYDGRGAGHYLIRKSNEAYDRDARDFGKKMLTFGSRSAVVALDWANQHRDHDARLFAIERQKTGAGPVGVHGAVAEVIRPIVAGVIAHKERLEHEEIERIARVETAERSRAVREDLAVAKPSPVEHVYDIILPAVEGIEAQWVGSTRATCLAVAVGQAGDEVGMTFNDGTEFIVQPAQEMKPGNKGSMRRADICECIECSARWEGKDFAKCPFCGEPMEPVTFTLGGEVKAGSEVIEFEDKAPAEVKNEATLREKARLVGGDMPIAEIERRYAEQTTTITQTQKSWGWVSPTDGKGGFDLWYAIHDEKEHPRYLVKLPNYEVAMQFVRAQHPDKLFTARAISETDIHNEKLPPWVHHHQPLRAPIGNRPGYIEAGEYTAESLGVDPAAIEKANKRGILGKDHSKGKIHSVKFVTIRGKKYVTCGAMYRGDYRERNLIPAIPAAEWMGESSTTTYQPQAAGHFGLIVAEGKSRYVLGHRREEIRVAYQWRELDVEEERTRTDRGVRKSNKPVSADAATGTTSEVESAPGPRKVVVLMEAIGREGAYWFETEGSVNCRFPEVEGFVQPGWAFRFQPMKPEDEGRIRSQYPQLPAFSRVDFKPKTFIAWSRDDVALYSVTGTSEADARRQIAEVDARRPVGWEKDYQVKELTVATENQLARMRRSFRPLHVKAPNKAVLGLARPPLPDLFETQGKGAAHAG